MTGSPPNRTDTFLSGANALYVAELYARYLESAGDVDRSWADFFATLRDEEREILDDLRGATWAPSDSGVIGRFGNGGLMEADAGVAFEPAPQGAAYAPPAAEMRPSADAIRTATKDTINIRVHYEITQQVVIVRKRINKFFKKSVL